MFEPGKTYKIKVETTPGEFGFGRATVLEKSASNLTFQLRTDKEPNKVLPKGTRIWFVADSANFAFNGLWASSVVAKAHSAGQPIMQCSLPKFEAVRQNRRNQRVNFEGAVGVASINGEELAKGARTRDISRSGTAVESSQASPKLEPGSIVKLKIDGHFGAIVAEARVIRVENNWLANKTIIGLEFTQIGEESVNSLDKMLVALGGKPRGNEAELLKAIKEAVEARKAVRLMQNKLSKHLSVQSSRAQHSPFIGARSDQEESAKLEQEARNNEKEKS